MDLILNLNMKLHMRRIPKRILVYIKDGVHREPSQKATKNTNHKKVSYYSKGA